MTVEESIHVVFDETTHTEQESMKNYVEDDDQNTILHPIVKQPIDSMKQPVEILHQDDLRKEWRIPRDLSVDNIIGQIDNGMSTRNFISNYYKHYIWSMPTSISFLIDKRMSIQ